MRITRVEAVPVRIPIKPERRMITALGKHEVSDYVLVKLETDVGITGVGEATVMPIWSGESVWGAYALIQHLFAPALIGCDPADIDDIHQRMSTLTYHNWFTRAAIEMACLDAVGKEAGKPIFDLFDGTCRPLTIRNRFSLGGYPPELAAERAAERVAAGFDTIKIKVGLDPAGDVARVRAVREAVGPDISLMVDANGGWTEEQAIWTIERITEYRLTLVEQPLRRGNYSGLRRVREQTGCRILADESCFDEIEAVELIEQGCCDVLSLYPGKNGGITPARRIAALAARHNIPCSIGSNLEWDLGAAAMLHFIVSSPNMQVDLYPGDCLGPYYHEVSIATNPLQIAGPLTTLNTTPGLGIDVNWNVIETQRIHW